jgi:hypothetical protein
MLDDAPLGFYGPYMPQCACCKMLVLIVVLISYVPKHCTFLPIPYGWVLQDVEGVEQLEPFIHEIFFPLNFLLNNVPKVLAW